MAPCHECAAATACLSRVQFHQLLLLPLLDLLFLYTLVFKLVVQIKGEKREWLNSEQEAVEERLSGTVA